MQKYIGLYRIGSTMSLPPSLDSPVYKFKSSMHVYIHASIHA